MLLEINFISNIDSLMQNMEPVNILMQNKSSIRKDWKKIRFYFISYHTLFLIGL
jgi:hypothetical protein